MVIAINARVLNERRGGPARYTHNIIRELAAIDRKNRYILLMQEPYDFGAVLPGNFTITTINVGSKLLFDYLVLPVYSWFHKIDIFLFPKNTFSPLIRAKKIPVYHDIIYFEDTGFREYSLFDNLHHHVMISIGKHFSAADLTVSDFTASRMKRLLGIRPGKIVIIKEGVESRFAPGRSDALAEQMKKKFSISRPFLFYSGSLSPRKNMINVLKAFLLIKDRIPHNIYFTGGDSWRDNDLYRFIREHQLEDRVIKLGYISDDDLVAMYSLADCYLYPSLYEGFGLPILEAQACGCPVITSGISSCPEVAGESAALVDPSEPEQIAYAIERIVTDRSYRDILIEKGFINCKKYSWRTTAEGVLKLFNSLDAGK
ncbi:MAG: glycosyltransferase family 4 protein [Spirochaetota bacterium]